ncbi:unnamed protein product [Closterium sp. Yama58-4]|nr:unnamed protein product [Closterium sp. Yama58-4]
MPFKDLATVDNILLCESPAVDDKEARLALRRLQEVGVGALVPVEALAASPLPNAVALLTLEQAKLGVHKHLPQGAARFAVSVRGDESEEDLKALVGLDAVMLLAHVPPQPKDSTISRVHASRRLFEFLPSNNITTPVIHHISFPDGTSKDDRVLQSGAEAGCRMRNTKTEFVSCPSCGRTLFDLQEVTASICECTSHLPGVAIAIMGCIVNGPGEMADADFGYVGGAPSKIDLYVGKEVVQRGIPMEEAIDALVKLIEDHGCWVEPAQEEEVQAVAA